MAPARLHRYLVFLLIFAATPGFAASKLEPPELSSYLRWGPLRVRPALFLKHVGYDDNVLANDENRVSDYTATIASGLEGLVLFGDRTFLTFKERLDYTAYLHTSEQNFLNYSHSGRLTVPFGRFGVFTDLALSELRERPIDREDIRTERREARFGAGLILQLGWRTEIEIAHGKTDFRYTDEDPGSTVSDRLDRVEEGNSLEAGYLLLGRTRLTLDAARKDVTFDNRPLRDSETFSILPGVKLGEGGPLTGRIRLGWSEVEPKDPTLAEFSGLVGDAQLAYRLRSRTTLRLGFERRLGFAVFAQQRLFRLTEIESRVIHYLNNVFGVEVGGSVGRLTFQDENVNPREDDLLRYDVGLRMRLVERTLGRRVDYVLRVSRYQRESTVAAADNDRTTFGIHAVADF